MATELETLRDHARTMANQCRTRIRAEISTGTTVATLAALIKERDLWARIADEIDAHPTDTGDGVDEDQLQLGVDA